MQIFLREAAPAAPQDALTEAQQSADKLANALTKAESESSDAKVEYDRALHHYILSGKKEDEPSLEPQRLLAGKLDSLRRLHGEARQHLTRVASEVEAAKRLDAIRASGSHVAGLVAVGEAKLAQFREAVEAVRQAEADLFTVLFDPQAGLRQNFGIAQKDADFARGRLRHQVIEIARRGPCRVDARFETDCEVHLGELEAAFYAAQ